MSRGTALTGFIGFIWVAGLVLAAGLTRLLPHAENFAPFTAIAIFAGARFASRRTAILVPLAALLLKDLILELMYRNGMNDSWGIYCGMWIVYGSLALVALIGRLAQGTRSPIKVVGTTLAGSCVFFLLTNFVWWYGGELYPLTWDGLVTCYLSALPFFRNALVGDFMYATALFGAWAFVEARFPSMRLATAPAPA
jgi:hypothetical protein